MKHMAKLLLAIGCAVCLMSGTAIAGDIIRYSSSAQVYEAFGEDMLTAFKAQTGIEVDRYVLTSGSAINRLMNGIADIASTAEGLYYRHQEYGYVEIPFCRDPLTVIVHPSNPVTNLTEAQVLGIFGGDITNWKAVGGPDSPIVVIVPGRNTAAYKNFDRLVIKRKEIVYDFMTYKSTKAIEGVKHFANAVSFIGQGAAASYSSDVKTLKLDGVAPTDSAYPYYQTFSLVTKGQPAGPVKAFVDFVTGEHGKDVMKKRGMSPVAK